MSTTTPPGLPRRLVWMAVVSVYSISDGLSTTAIGALPVFPVLYFLDISLPTLGFFVAGMAGLSAAIGGVRARQYYEYGYPLLRHWESDGPSESSQTMLLGTLFVHVLASLAISTALGVALQPYGMPLAAAAAVLYPSFDNELSRLRWYLSPSSLVVGVGAKIFATDGAVRSVRAMPSVSDVDFREVFNPEDA